MKKAVLSGDIIASTCLTDEGRSLVEEQLNKLTIRLSKDFDVYCRILKGDYLECVINEPQDALRLALATKCFVKSLSVHPTIANKGNNRTKNFATHGIRLAIGFGSLSRYNPEKGIIDGEAVYLAGRTINESGTHNKKRVTIKNTLYFVSANEELNASVEPLIALLDVLLSKATAKQCQVLFLKLMRHSEEEIAQLLGITQPVVNQHSTSGGWNAVEKSVIYFSNMIQKYTV